MTVNAIDPKVFGKVAVMLGGDTAEREIPKAEDNVPAPPWIPK